jgi:tetratricopeptide (TPR) repeat protein
MPGRITRTIPLFLLALFLVSSATPALAAHAEKAAKQSKYANAATRRRQAVGQRCAKKLEAAQRAIDAEQWSQAEQVLTLAGEKYCISSFEKSQVWNYLGYAHFSQQHYRRAVEAYLRLLDEPAAEMKMKVSTYNTVAQLYFQLEDYASAAQFLERLLKASAAVDPQAGVHKADAQIADAKTRALLAQAYYQLDRKKDALVYIKQAINDYQHSDKLPPEAWWSLQSLLYFEQEQYRQALPVLKQLIKHYPRYRYWHQLGGLYGQLNKNIERLVATEIVYLAGALKKERELVSLAYLYLGANTPYRAAVTLETAMNNKRVTATAEHLELLGQAWQQAGEGKKARPVLEKAAALSGEGKIYAQLAGVYLDIGDNAKAVTAAQNALQKGQLKRPGAVHLVLGNAQLNLHCYDKAVIAFEQASKYKAAAVNAKQWLNYARAEGERVKDLLEAGAKLEGCGA